jgi:hypothetical protein
MPNPNLGLPVGQIRKPAEASQWVPASDSTSPYQNWKHSAADIAQGQALSAIAGSVNRALASIPTTYPVDYSMHPFKVYQYPFYAVYGDEPGVDTIAEDFFGTKDIWRLMTMRTGMFIENSAGVMCDNYVLNQETGGYDLTPGALSGIPLSVDYIGLPDESVITFGASAVSPDNFSGTVWSGYNPAASIIYNEPQGYPFIAPDTAISWIWAEIIGYKSGFISFPEYGSVAVVDVKCSDDPASDGWENFPNYNPYIYPIATLDTISMRDQQKVLVRQIRKDNIVVNPRSFGFFGKLQAIGDIDFSHYGGRGVPNGAIVYTKDTTNKGLYASRRWFNDVTTSFPVNDDTNWVKIGPNY